MSAPVALLNAMAQALSTMALYGAGHPMRGRVIATCHGRLRELQAADPLPLFSFLDGEVVYGTQPLHEMRYWQWAARLSAAGVQRLEFTGAVTPAELEELLERLLSRLGGSGGASECEGTTRAGGVRFGAVGIRDGAASRGTDDGADASAGRFALGEEITAVRWILAQAGEHGVVAGPEARAVARSLVLLRQRDGGRTVPIVQLPSFDDYLVMHAVNVASLSYALAEALRLPRAEAFGAAVAGLLHDIGMTRVPPELKSKNTLTPAERRDMEEHVRTGSRMILSTAPDLEVAAVVAYEHHLLPDGSGYPAMAVRRTPHRISQLVRVCSVYHAVTSSRFHWPAWPADLALRYLEEGAGREFDAECAEAFVAMLRGSGVGLLPVVHGSREAPASV